MIYLDYAATAKPNTNFYEQAQKEALNFFGNPSSSHPLGQSSAQRLHQERTELAQALQVKAEQLVFTSGATEANQLVLLNLLTSPARGTVLVNETEHASIYENLGWLKTAGYTVEMLKVDRNGCLDTEHLAIKLNKSVQMVICMAVNNQSGTINNVEKIAQQLRSYSSSTQGRPIHFHVDGVQALGKIPVNLTEWDCDTVAFSGHKLGAPRGCGLLYMRQSRAVLLKGGGQENGLRSGTENLYGIIGLSMGIKMALKRAHSYTHEAKLLSVIRKAGGMTVPIDREAGSPLFTPYIISVHFPVLPGEVMQRVLAMHGVYVGTGSACSSQSMSRLRPLLAMGLRSEDAQRVVRLSFDESLSEADIDELERVLAEIKQKYIVGQ
jgi:cysteine desulfurase